MENAVKLCKNVQHIEYHWITSNDSGGYHQTLVGAGGDQRQQPSSSNQFVQLLPQLQSQIQIQSLKLKTLCNTKGFYGSGKKMRNVVLLSPQQTETYKTGSEVPNILNDAKKAIVGWLLMSETLVLTFGWPACGLWNHSYRTISRGAGGCPNPSDVYGFVQPAGWPASIHLNCVIKSFIWGLRRVLGLFLMKKPEALWRWPSVVVLSRVFCSTFWSLNLINKRSLTAH